ncbi:hypothetical protein [uncultured Lacinutrix sp.]|uniref:hypothetical protein n=1 Tax=uncultured Lacinutrix sp. TaxID=574032 RepID=UPI00261B0E6D|nr:hypothetical protein [uncultured Lacinutrix sp.]
MKKTLSILFILTISISLLQAQEDNKTNSQGSMLTFNLVSPIIDYTPRWNIGYTKPLNEKWLIGLELGYGNHDITIVDYNRIEKDYKLWEIRPQVYYILNPNYKMKMYLSAELFYINHTDTFFNENYNINNNSQNIRYDKADYKRIKTGGNLNFGAFINFSKYIGVNPSIGLGVRNRNVSYSNVVNPQETMFNDDDGDWFGTNNYIEDTGNNFNINFALNLKLYYRF